jgi:MFS family permease
MQRPNTRFKRGLVAGLLGAAVVVIWFFILDVIAGQPFRTPAALGSSLLFGKSTIELSARVIVAYTVFHFLAFIVAGLLFVWITERIERRPSFVFFALLFVILGEALALANLATYAQWGLGSIGVWSVTIANLLSIAVMAWYIWATHPVLRRLTDEPPPTGTVRV